MFDASQVTLRDDCYDAHGGEVFCTLYAILPNDVYSERVKQPIGRLDYSVYGDEYNIKHIFVEQEFRRHGIATMLMKRLEEDAMQNGKTINRGYSTNDGTEFLKSLDQPLLAKGGSWFRRIAQKAMPLPFQNDVPFHDDGVINIDETMREPIAKKQEQQFPNMGYLGSGGMGIAYHDPGTNVVIKYCRDIEEAEVAARMIRNPLPCVAKILSVTKLQNKPLLYSIVSEKVRNLTNTEQYSLRQYKYFRKDPVGPYVAIADPIDNKIHSDYHTMLTCLEENGLDTGEAHGNNVGYNQEGRLVLFDLGGSLGWQDPPTPDRTVI